MTSPEERLNILERLEKGEITPQEAERLLSGEKPRPASRIEILNQLERGEITADQAAEQLGHAANTTDHKSKRYEDVKTEYVVDKYQFDPAKSWGWWLLPLAGGLGLTLIAAMWMSSSLANNGALSFGFLCAWVPLAIGLLLVVVGWAIRRGHWVHVQVQSNKPGQKMHINLHVPAPTQLVTGLLEGFGVHIPGMDSESVKKVVDAIHEGKKNGHPLHIQAHDTHDDDKVDIVIT